MIGIINPPYSLYDPTQQVNRTGGAGNGSKYHLFCQQLIKQTSESVHLTPDGWMINPKHKDYRDFLLAHGLKSIHLVSRKIFFNAKLMGDVAIYHLQDQYAGDVIVKSANAEFSISRTDIKRLGFIPQVNPNLYKYVSKSESLAGMFNKGKHPTTPLVGNRTKAYCDTLQPTPTPETPIRMISRLGGSLENNEVLYISKPSKAFYTDKVCVTAASAERKLTYLQFVPQGIDVSEKIIYLPVSSAEEGRRLIDYLNSDLVKTIVSGIKILSHNSKFVFSQIPKPGDCDIIFDQTPINWIQWNQYTYGGQPVRETNRKKVTSEVFTPDQVAEFMVSLIEGQGVVFDPCCGDGQLLAAAQARGFDIVGCDIMLDNCIAATNRLGIDITQKDFLEEKRFVLEDFFN